MTMTRFPPAGSVANVDRSPDVPSDPSPRVLFARGFVGLLPFWAGAIPIGIAYGVAARGMGLSFAETQLMSVVVFSAAAQVSAISLLDAGAPALAVLATGLALNAQILLIGLTVARQVAVSPPVRPLAAFFLTEGAYGIALGFGRLRLPILLGAGVGMFVAWNTGTAIGAAAGDVLPDPRRLGADFVVPVTFLAVLVPLLRTRAAIVTALVAAAVTLLLVWVAPSVTILGAGLVGSAAGAWWARRERAAPAAAPEAEAEAG